MRWLPPLLLLIAIAPARADEIRCLTGGSRGQIHLEWKLPAATTEGDQVSHVRCAGQTRWLQLTLASQESSVLAEDRPWQFDTVWEEHLDGKVIGHYAISTQGANIYNFKYTNARTGRQTAFGEDFAASGDAGCH